MSSVTDTKMHSCVTRLVSYFCNTLLQETILSTTDGNLSCEWTAAGTKRSLSALHENGVVFRDDFESSGAFNSALW